MIYVISLVVLLLFVILLLFILIWFNVLLHKSLERIEKRNNYNIAYTKYIIKAFIDEYRRKNK